MLQMSESTFISANGSSSVYYREYRPEGEAVGIVQLVHGIAEYIARYDAFARFLCENGYIVVGNDHIGHGQSIADDTEKGYVGEDRGWETMVEDMRALHDRTCARFPGKPYFLFGHSMGSFLTRTYLIRYRSGLDGAILSGTGHMGAALVKGGQLLGSLECRRKGAAYRSDLLNNVAFGKYNDGLPCRTPFDWLSRDDALVDAYVADPLCGFVPSAGLFREMMDGIAFITAKKNITRMNHELPVFFISGDRDPVGEKGAGVIRAYTAFLNAGMSDVTMKLYQGARHEILNEINREEVYRDVLAWLNSKVGK